MHHAAQPSGSRAGDCSARRGAGFRRAGARPGPPGTPSRIRESFGFGWKFAGGEAAGAQQPAFAGGGWWNLNLPHDWSIEGPFAQDEPSGAPTGIAWYRKHFRTLASYADRRVSHEFDGVYQNSEVWTNGPYLGKRPFGYISFAYDITPYLKLNGDNVLPAGSFEDMHDLVNQHMGQHRRSPVAIQLLHTV